MNVLNLIIMIALAVAAVITAVGHWKHGHTAECFAWAILAFYVLKDRLLGGK